MKSTLKCWILPIRTVRLSFEIYLTSVDPLPSSDIKDEEQPVTAEMIKQRKVEQEALEKKRKEEVSIKGRPAAEIKEGQIAVEDIESEKAANGLIQRS